MGVRVQIRNVDKVEKFIRELPKNLDRELSSGNQIWMESLQKKAKLRAPKDTGALKESIKLSPVRKGKNFKQWKLVVDAPYALFQEEGFTPHRFFAGTGFNSSKLTPGTSYFVTKFTPFIGPAFKENLKKFDAMLDKSLKRAIR